MILNELYDMNENSRGNKRGWRLLGTLIGYECIRYTRIEL